MAAMMMTRVWKVGDKTFESHLEARRYMTEYRKRMEVENLKHFIWQFFTPDFAKSEQMAIDLTAKLLERYELKRRTKI